MYLHGSEKRLIQTATGDKLDRLEVAFILKKAKKMKILQDWE